MKLKEQRQASPNQPRARQLRPANGLRRRTLAAALLLLTWLPTAAAAQPHLLMTPVGLSTSPRLDGAQSSGQNGHTRLRAAASELAQTSVFTKPRRPEISSVDPNNPPRLPEILAQAQTEVGTIH